MVKQCLHPILCRRTRWVQTSRRDRLRKPRNLGDPRRTKLENQMCTTFIYIVKKKLLHCSSSARWVSSLGFGLFLPGWALTWSSNQWRLWRSLWYSLPFVCWASFLPVKLCLSLSCLIWTRVAAFPFQNLLLWFMTGTHWFSVWRTELSPLLWYAGVGFASFTQCVRFVATKTQKQSGAGRFFFPKLCSKWISMLLPFLVHVVSHQCSARFQVGHPSLCFLVLPSQYFLEECLLCFHCRNGGLSFVACWVFL